MFSCANTHDRRDYHQGGGGEAKGPILPEPQAQGPQNNDLHNKNKKMTF